MEKKWMAVVKIFDAQLSGQWHSGSCTTYQSKFGCETQHEADEFIKEVEATYERRNAPRGKYDKYQLTSCVLNYDEDKSRDVESVFKYM